MTIRTVPTTFHKYTHNQFQANCLPISLANVELRIRRIRCNATVVCYCVANYSSLPVLMTSKLVENNVCDGGQWTCDPPRDCCKQGCCFFPSSLYKGAPPSQHPGSVFNPLFLGHWYFWLAVTATVAGILCACSLWRKHSQGNLCCRTSNRDDRASEPDSNGSCYAPPQYSRCNSFHQAPPPYSEVTSKPDLYPLVISYNAEPVSKSNSGSTGYLMVQYFRNFIVRPVGTLSATSTLDSLSSSFLCNAANEANTIIPPPYSHMGSLEEISTESQGQQTTQERHIPRSASANSNREGMHTSPSIHSQSSGMVSLVPPTPIHQRSVSPRQLHQVVSVRDNPCFGQNTTKIVNSANPIMMPNESLRTGRVDNKCQTVCDLQATIPAIPRKLTKPKFSKEDSESQDEDHNFSDLLNLSVCVPSSVIHSDNPIQTSPQNHEFYSVTNSIGSDISSLANLGSPDSPPRATSPTVEMRELLGKIQQLPQQRSPVQHQHLVDQRTSRNYFHKIKAKTLYMPLCDETLTDRSKNVPNVFSRSWTSRSAPCTPSGNFVPSFFSHHHKTNQKTNQKGSKTKLADGSPLLKEHAEESEGESNIKDEHL